VTELNQKAFRGLFGFLLVLGALLFFPAWSLNYWQAWLFLTVLLVSSLAITLYLAKNDPRLLERRISAGPAAEKESKQKTIQAISSIGLASMVVVAALDHRFRWSWMPTYLGLLGDLLVAIGFLVVFFVYRENTFASATIEVAPDQKVVSTGPYALVRHPMYTGSLFWFIGTPFALGSWWGFVGLLPVLGALVWRILEEEKLLARDLPGYSEYQQKVTNRLLPFVW
jgi:protein-S-isoprenylcysteine O-methyltransferase Ste14